jgi:hypothetical protein
MMFHRTIHKHTGRELVFLHKDSVADVAEFLYKEVERRGTNLLSFTISEIEESTDKHQSTVSTAVIDHLEKAPLVMRLPMPLSSRGAYQVCPIPSVISYTGKSMEVFEKVAQFPSPGDRARGVLLSFTRDLYQQQGFLNNNAEALVLGNLLQIVPHDEVEVTIDFSGRSCMEVCVSSIESIASERWEQVVDEAFVTTLALASRLSYTPKSGDCLSQKEVREAVSTPIECDCTTDVCQHWIVDFVDPDYWR